MAWTDILGGGVINPAHTLMKTYTPLANLTLEWPGELAGDNVMGDITEIVAVQAGLTITLPDATKGGEGIAALFINKGQQDITLLDAGGTSVGVMSPGRAYFVYLAAGTTLAGTWTVFTFAAGSSIAQAAQLSSSSVAARGNTLVQATPVRSLNGNATIGTPDQGSVMNWVGGVGTYTMAEAGALGQGWFCHVKNSGTGALTVGVTSGSGNLIDGAVQISFNPGESAILVCDGTKFVTISKTVTSVTQFSYTSIDVSGTGNLTLSQTQVGYDVYRFVGTLTGNRTITVPTTLDQFTVRNECTGAFTLTVKTAAAAGTVVAANEAKIVYCDGNDIKPASTAGVSFPIALSQGGTGGIDADSALSNLGASAIGKALFQAASATAARSALAFGALGDAIANAVSQLLLPNGTVGAPTYSFSGDPDTGLYAVGAGVLGLAVNGVQRFQFDLTGASYYDGSAFRAVATYFAPGDLRVYGYSGSAGQGVVRFSSDTSKYLHYDGANYNLVGGALTVSGNISANSDARLKRDVVPIGSALERLKGIVGVEYTRIETGQREMGLIAQNVREHAPLAVSGDETLAVAYGNLIALVIEAVKELEARG